MKSGDRRFASGLGIGQRIAIVLEGVQTAWREDQGVRNQFIGATLMLIALMVVRPAGFWGALAIFASLTVLAFELMNTALERTIDYVDKSHSDAIKKLKNIAAAAVVIASLGTTFIELMMIFSEFGEIFFV